MIPVGVGSEAPAGSFERAIKRGGLQGRPWRRKREEILRRDLWMCQCQDCSKRPVRLPAHEVDHIVEVVDGGGDEDSNLRAINRDCHLRKTRQAEKIRRGGGY